MLFVRYGHNGALDSYCVSENADKFWHDFITISDGSVTFANGKTYLVSDIDSITFQMPEIDVPDSRSRIAVLDMTVRNGENESSGDFSRNVYSAEYMMELAGLPYFVTQDLDYALAHADMILITSGIKTSSFKAEDYKRLKSWVENGGTLISPALTTASALKNGGTDLFGITETNYSKLRHRLRWTALGEKECMYFDTSEEQEVSLARGKDASSASEGIKTYGYKISDDAEALAMFNDTAVAVVRHKVGLGTAYSFALMWRDVIQRNQLNKDFEAQRTYSNSFEPSADVYPFFIRAAYTASHQFSVWKCTVPDGYKSVLIPTHDCDSRTAYNEMHWMSDYEKSIGLNSHFFLTVHYFRDAPYLSAFYDDASIAQCRRLIANGHTIGSHSVCHFPDFSVTDRFPLTIVSQEQYVNAHHDVESNITTNGSTWAEVVMSKQIIDEDLGLDIRSFRSGHLCMNKNIPAANQMAGYAFESCYSASDVLSEFAFQERLGNNWDGNFNGTLTMPLHISDIIKSDPIDENNWTEKPARWYEVIRKLQGNYAPCILLIHPNRDWKMKVERQLVELLDRQAIGLYNFEAYGDFWNARRSFDFDYGYDEITNTVFIMSTATDIEANPHLTLILEQGNGTLPSNAVMTDETGRQIPMSIHPYDVDRYVLRLEGNR